MSIVSKTVALTVAHCFGIRKKSDEKKLDEKMFDDLWEILQIGRKYERDNSNEKNKDKDKLGSAVARSYATLGDIVANHKPKSSLGFKRVAKTTRSRLVILSDHHMTYRGHRHDYFHAFNFDLYLEVLRHYAQKGFMLVENGDVEELLIFEPTLAETERRRKLVRKPTLGLDDIGKINWNELEGLRIEKRKKMLEQLIDDNRAYYNTVKQEFGRENYVKLSGNHDTYESPLLEDMIESVFWKGVVKDLLIVERKHQGSSGLSSEPYFAITHGHQFDKACVAPHAGKVGEVISECLSWAYQGPDRIWQVRDTYKWTGDSKLRFNNDLSSEQAPAETGNATLEAFLESTFGHQVAWEYFENKKPAVAFTKEVLTGDEFFKFRHMDENNLANAMFARWRSLPYIPTLICGHTHEVRDRATFTNVLTLPFTLVKKKPPSEFVPPGAPNANVYTRYMNSGSAGRFENLIWCVEIEDKAASVYSWTNSGTSGRIKLKKLKWTSDNRGQLIGAEVPA